MKKEPFRFFRYIAEKIYLILFIIAVGVGLIFSVLSLTNILMKNETNRETRKSVTTFDESTIEKINKYNKSQDNKYNVNTSPRTNPFKE